ncbi:PaaI family thioesterase [Nocardioides sp. Kera G14]|uniref:PaaI family thioesterase n=1 Tax=Nocardioides sp. Kera G14 TaxID=2884264 RepID=UPI001D12A854|nr:PaaI family thioesterase [Nocardioides sp. Kera G14]UDY22216.1 PaaI family thioesterase [Nocardioides sp. Kera G14]
MSVDSRDYASIRTGFVENDLTPEEVERTAAAVEPLVDSVRELLDALIRSEVDAGELDSIRSEVDALVARLRTKQIPGAYGVRADTSGRHRAWGNPVVGLRNAMSPPLEIQHDESDGSAWAETVLGARFEGPPGMVHGGISALLLDQIVGHAASAAGKPGMTGTLKLRYVAPTPLGPIRLEARTEKVDGIKAIVRAGSYVDDPANPGERRLCVEAEAIMILPRWARELEETSRSMGPIGDEGAR